MIASNKVFGVLVSHLGSKQKCENPGQVGVAQSLQAKRRTESSQVSGAKSQKPQANHDGTPAPRAHRVPDVRAIQLILANKFAWDLQSPICRNGCPSCCRNSEVLYL